MVEVWSGFGNHNYIVEVLRKEGKIEIWFKTIIAVRRWDANSFKFRLFVCSTMNLDLYEVSWRYLHSCFSSQRQKS